MRILFAFYILQRVTSHVTCELILRISTGIRQCAGIATGHVSVGRRRPTRSVDLLAVQHHLVVIASGRPRGASVIGIAFVLKMRD